jgi:hypothetical protein
LKIELIFYFYYYSISFDILNQNNDENTRPLSRMFSYHLEINTNFDETMDKDKFKVPGRWSPIKLNNHQQQKQKRKKLNDASILLFQKS